MINWEVWVSVPPFYFISNSMKFVKFLKIVLTKKELNRFYKELNEHNPDLSKIIESFDYREINISGCFIFRETRKDHAYWHKLNKLVAYKKETLVK